jgi:hypothetical protein
MPSMHSREWRRRVRNQMLKSTGKFIGISRLKPVLLNLFDLNRVKAQTAKKLEAVSNGQDSVFREGHWTRNPFQGPILIYELVMHRFKLVIFATRHRCAPNPDGVFKSAGDIASETEF